MTDAKKEIASETNTSPIWTNIWDEVGIFLRTNSIKRRQAMSKTTRIFRSRRNEHKYFLIHFVTIEFPPHHLVYDAGVRQYDLYDLGGHILVHVVGHKDTILTVAVEFHCCINRL